LHFIATRNTSGYAASAARVGSASTAASIGPDGLLAGAAFRRIGTPIRRAEADLADQCSKYQKQLRLLAARRLQISPTRKRE